MIPNNILHKLCLIYGNQQLLVEEAVDSIIEERLKGQKYEWSLERFNAHDLIKTSGEFGTKKLEDLLISCETFPMFTDRKVIQIDNFDLVKKSRNNFEKNTQYSLFETIDK